MCVLTNYFLKSFPYLSSISSSSTMDRSCAAFSVRNQKYQAQPPPMRAAKFKVATTASHFTQAVQITNE